MTANYLGSGGQIAFAESFYRYFVFQEARWSYARMNLERDVAYADQHVGKLMNSIDPDLRPFRDRGGKLIQYHGWADWGITPYSSIDYFNTRRVDSWRIDVGCSASGRAEFHGSF